MMKSDEKAYVDSLFASLKCAIQTGKNLDGTTQRALTSLVTLLEDAVPELVMAVEVKAFYKGLYDKHKGA